MNLASAHPSVAGASILLAALALVGCTAKSSEPDTVKSTGPAPTITVAATDTACSLSTSTNPVGSSTFTITNSGTKVTEFYIYGEGDRVMGEVENISPGLQRTLVVHLAQPGTYQTACKPGMIGDGIRANFTVTGEAVKSGADGTTIHAADDYKRYLISQTDALVATTQTFVDAIKKSDIASAKAQYPLARTYYERIEPVAESFPNDLDPRLDLREADLAPGEKWSGFHRLEKDLWTSGLQPDTNAVADQLLADTRELDSGVTAADYTIESTQIAGGAQTLLDEISKSKITGEEDLYSHTDLWDFQANIQGSQTAVASLRPILDERNPDLGKKVDQRFTEVEALLANHRTGDAFVSYETVTEPERQQLSRALDALSNEVSQIQGVVAPR